MTDECSPESGPSRESSTSPKDNIYVRDIIIKKIRNTFRVDPLSVPPHHLCNHVRDLLNLYYEWKELQVPRLRSKQNSLQQYIVYSIARLCHWFDVQDSGLVADSLMAIFQCDGHFSGIFLHAFRDKDELKPSWRWKKYKTTDRTTEAVGVVIFFLEHANRQKLLFQGVRLIDLNLVDSDAITPGVLAAVCGQPQLLLILLQYGAFLRDSLLRCKQHIPLLLRKLIHSLWFEAGVNLDEEKTSSQNFLNVSSCLRFLLRAVPSIHGSSLHFDLQNFKNLAACPATHSADFISLLSRRGFVPPLERRYSSPSELLHLCRYSIRIRLHELWNLPHGIFHLPVPNMIKDYIHLLKD